MSVYLFIISKLIKINKFSLLSLSNISIFISTFLCALIIPIVLSVNEGFKLNVKDKIIQFDGYARLHIDSLLNKNLKNKFSEVELIARTKFASEGIILSKQEFPIKQINSFLLNIDNLSKVSDGGIYIGEGLYEKLKVKDLLKKTIYFINNDLLINEYNVIGVYRTGVPYYDNNFAVQKFTFEDHDYDGNILNKSDYENFVEFNNTESIITFDEKYSEFINWLNTYDLPIYFLLGFIIFIAFLNNSACYNFEKIDKYVDKKHYKLIGLSDKIINNIFIMKFFIIIYTAIIFGSFLSFIILILENKINFITIPNTIYFTSELPIDFKLKYFIFTPVIFFIQVIYIYMKDNIYES